jgi:hypothetical protein
MVNIEVVTTPGAMGLDELERPAGIDSEGNCGGVIVGCKMVNIEVVTTPGAMRLDELERLSSVRVDSEGNCGDVIVEAMRL